MSGIGDPRKRGSDRKDERGRRPSEYHKDTRSLNSLGAATNFLWSNIEDAVREANFGNLLYWVSCMVVHKGRLEVEGDHGPIEW